MYGKECFEEEYIQEGYKFPFKKLPSIENKQCMRCGNRELETFPCIVCNKECLYCRSCISTGVSRSCKYIVRADFPQYKWEFEDLIHWEEKLTKEQFRAATNVLNAIISQTNSLLWAVCGAGKSEMLYPGISYALANNLSVCWAAPRKDVVLELYPRLQEIFPQIKIHALYGDSDDNQKWAPLIVTTTHQLIHFHEAFDVMILDEADAFPYSKDKNLPFYLNKASKPNAPLITVTATPSKQQIKEATKLSILPARYHGHPLPIPKMKWVGNWKKQIRKQKLHRQIKEWLLKQVKEKHPIFFFIPHARDVESVVEMLQNEGFSAQGVHSQDPNRKEKVEDFRKGKFDVIVTTTILERGVTIPNVSVAVLGAEEEVFTESALVQICGRGGRNASFPTSDMLFFHNGITVSMKSAVKHIKKMNAEATTRGLLRC